MNRLQQIITQLDTLAFHWCQGHARAPQLASVSRWVSRLGDGLCYILLGVALAHYPSLLLPLYGLASLIGACRGIFG